MFRRAVSIAVVALAVATVAPPSRASADQAAAIRACQFSGPEVWLSFDDALDARVLTILAEHGVRAMFFMTGNFARAYPSEMQKIYDAGHIVGNHSSTHQRLTTLSDAQVLAEIDGGVRGTQTPPLLRPPYGSYDQRVINLAASRGYRLCTWTVASGDSGGATATEIINNAKKLQAGGVFIMHPKAAHTIEALPGVIAAIRAKRLTLAGLR
jgi:peptidoglycan/xylan/chitin deacetylase (PgdA/CDA1 family)